MVRNGRDNSTADPTICHHKQLSCWAKSFLWYRQETDSLGLLVVWALPVLPEKQCLACFVCQESTGAATTYGWLLAQLRHTAIQQTAGITWPGDQLYSKFLVISAQLAGAQGAQGAQGLNLRDVNVSITCCWCLLL